MPTATPATLPPWLAERRHAAAELLVDTPWPTPETEIWRYSRVGELAADRYAPVTAGAGEVGHLPLAEAVGERAGLVTVVDGRLASVDLGPEAVAAGVTVTVAERQVGDGHGDWFSVANEANAEPVVVTVPRGARLEAPLVLLQWVSQPGLITPRLVVDVADGAEAVVVDLSGSADVDALVAGVTELSVGAGANLRYASVQDLGPRVWQVSSQTSEVGAQGQLTSMAAALGGAYARVRTDSSLIGRGASAELIAVYFGSGNQMHDFRTFQHHVAPDTNSTLLFKGAVEDEARSVYTGLIRVGETAKGTAAHQTNRTIKLSPDTWAESVPNLEIHHNEVRCSHASTVGPIGDDERFYLESRGISPDSAERLIVLGFFDEVLDRLPVRALVEPLRRRVAETFDHRSVTSSGTGS